MLHKEMLKFGKLYVKKRKFHAVTKNSIYINDVDIQNIVVTSRYSISKKCFRYFVGYANQSDDDLK